MTLQGPGVRGLPIFETAGEVDPPSPSAEVRAGEEVLEELEVRDGTWLDRLRAALAELYERRVNERGRANAYVCADDARRLMEARPELQPPPGTSNNALGALFRPSGWRMVGFTKSETPGSHGNRIGQWVFEEAA